MAQKIMMRPCIVNRLPYADGVTAPSDCGNSREPRTGTGCIGKPHCQRIIIAITPPSPRKPRPEKMNWSPMTLWSMENTYLRMNEVTTAPVVGCPGGGMPLRAIRPLEGFARDAKFAHSQLQPSLPRAELQGLLSSIPSAALKS